MAVTYRGSKTAAIATAITELIQSMGDGIPTIDSFEYTNAGTAHTATIMRPVGSTVTTASSLSGVSTLTLNKTDAMKTTGGADEVLAASDYLVWVSETGKHFFDTVSSVSGSVVTLSNALTADVDLGATVWCLGEIARPTHTIITLPASVTTRIVGPIKAGYGSQTGVSSSRTGVGDVLLLSINNITAAGTMRYLAGSWSASDNVNV